MEKDTVAPLAVEFGTLDPVTSANKATYPVSGTCAADETGAVTVSINDGTNTAVTGTANCASETWTVSGLDVSSLTDGTLDVTADYSDAAGNAAPQAATTVEKS